MPLLLPAQAVGIAEPEIYRDEVVGLLFNVADIAATLASIERWLKEEDDDEEEGDEG